MKNTCWPEQDAMHPGTLNRSIYEKRRHSNVVKKHAYFQRVSLLYVFISLYLIEARIKNPVMIRCKMTTGHRRIPVKPPAQPT